MVKKIITTGLLVLTLFGINSQILFAKTVGSWKDLALHVNSEVALKPVNGKTIFGKVSSVSDSEIVLQVANKSELTSQTVSFKQSEVKKVWLANLRFKNNAAVSTGIGAAVGAAAGGGIAYGLLAATGGSDSGYEILGIGIAIGAGAGAALGFFAGKGGHKKQALIYEV